MQSGGSSTTELAGCTVREASPALGAVVEGLDLRAALARPDHAPEWQALRTLLAERYLVVVRGGPLTDEQHLACAARLGPVAPEGLVESRAIGFVSNVRPDGVLGADAASFHIDYGFFPEPYTHLTLYGLDIPPGGTETHFVNAVLAAATLPADLRARVAGLRARHVLDLSSATGQYDVRAHRGRVAAPLASQTRPVLWPHRDHGAEILGVWQQQTDSLEPLDDAEGVPLLLALYEHLYRAEHTYVHRWQPHDLVLWDNHALQHARPAVGDDAPRTLRRVCVGATQDLSIFLRARGGMAG